ncbi:hypothetical protein MC885_006341 [Smutsia gigantea]|nr:hypothetical protein MC885_006341 [Smutsia gigantea]
MFLKPKSKDPPQSCGSPVPGSKHGGPEEGKASGVDFFSKTKAQAFFFYLSLNAVLKPKQQNSWISPPSPSSLWLECGTKLFYQKVQGGCSSSKVGMLVTLTGMEMMAHGSPCCSKERRIM